DRDQHEGIAFDVVRFAHYAPSISFPAAFISLMSSSSVSCSPGVQSETSLVSPLASAFAYPSQSHPHAPQSVCAIAAKRFVSNPPPISAAICIRSARVNVSLWKGTAGDAPSAEEPGMTSGAAASWMAASVAGAAAVAAGAGMAAGLG